MTIEMTNVTQYSPVAIQQLMAFWSYKSTMYWYEWFLRAHSSLSTGKSSASAGERTLKKIPSSAYSVSCKHR